jgi:hypothetical protein
MRINYRLRNEQAIAGTGVEERGVPISTGKMLNIKWAGNI